MASIWMEIWERREETPTFLFQLVPEKIDYDAADRQYIRVKAGGRFFFAHLSCFEGVRDFPRLSPDEEIFVGAHQLDDGCFWVHWLRTKSGVELAPGDDEALVAKQREAIATGKALLYFGSLIFFVMILVALFHRQTHGLLFPLAGFAGVALVGFGGYLVHRGAGVIRAVLGEEWQTLRKGLDRIRENDDDGFVAPPAGDASRPADPVPDDLGRDVDLVSGPIDGIGCSRREGTSVSVGDTPIDGPAFTVYDIACEGGTVAYPGHLITDQTFASLHHPSRLRKRFLFLAKGDRITAILNAHEGLLRNFARVVPDLGDGEAVVLINHEDGHIATSMSIQLVDPRHVLLVVGGVCALLFALLSALALFMVFSDGAKGNWTILPFGFFTLCSIWAGLCLLWELGKNGLLLLTGEASKRRRWEARVQALIEHLAPGRMRLPPRQTWVGVAKRVTFLVAAAGVSVFCIHLCILLDKAVR